MSVNYFIFLAFCISLTLAGCGGSADPEAERLLAQAVELHEQGLKLEAEVASQLEESATGAMADSLLAPALTHLKATLAWVRENRVEVPGHEHHHHGDGHEHNDHHHHAPPASLSPSDQVLLQQELLDSLTIISNRLRELKGGK